MKVLIATLSCCLSCCICFTVGQAQTTDTVPAYKNEAEQEDGWAKAFFVPAASREVHARYKGKIETVNDHVFRYNDHVLRVEPDTTGLLVIFASGVLYPAIFGARDVQVIAGVKEMEFLRTATARRFRMQVRFMGMANPVLYFFELTNATAKIDTPADVFIKGALLTFFKEYSVLI